MGCCPSTPYPPTQLPLPRRSPLLPPHDDVKETVKEVLSETQPAPLPTKSPTFDQPDCVRERSFRLPKMLESDRDRKPRIPSSQICNRSERFVSTADYRSSSGSFLRTPAWKNDGYRGNRSISPAKRPDERMQSPGSNAATARRSIRRTQDQSPGRRAPARIVGGTKADLGEGPRRRTRSPVTRVGRTESGRRTDPSPGRSRRLNHPKGEELMENPPVSLECFIFL
ncbi:hypothetical protein MLD38_016765 [Melastoma candidum]|uniref:Uncharacterized protein n=1 Tax=Melastoma candidum TaxID=119954 RepID=A0ACB9QSH8_9MYRT|nr:hypothetical protein MLD38_016765 [Melastoma candidum]